ncbi:MAG: hypothetical protein ACLSEY_14715 [Enterocloster sp.]
MDVMTDKGFWGQNYIKLVHGDSYDKYEKVVEEAFEKENPDIGRSILRKFLISPLKFLPRRQQGELPDLNQL